MNQNEHTHYYPIGRAVGWVIFGGALFLMTIFVFTFGLFGPFIIFGFVLGIAAVILGIRSLTSRKHFPMHMGEESLTFFRRRQEVRIAVKDLKRIWFNTSGIDKRVSLAMADGNIIDIPTLYGLDELRKKLQKRYDLTANEKA